MNADLKPSLIDLEVDNNTTGRKRLEPQRERLSERGFMYCVYWIKAEHHTDIEVQGYVGITKNISQRLHSHRKNRKKTPLTSAIKAYGFDNLQVVLLGTEYTQAQALAIEATYRPFPNIGWNLQRGGELGVDSSWYSVEANKVKHKEATANATRKWVAESDTKEKRAARAKAGWAEASTERRQQTRGSKNPKALLTEADVVEIKHELIPLGLSNKSIASLFGVKPYVISFIRTGKNWSYI